MQNLFVGSLVAIAVGVIAQGVHATDPEWALSEVKQGAAAIGAVIDRRLDYPMTYRFARGVLEKRVHLGKDTRGFQLGAHLALTHWLALMPADTTWRIKALSRHRNVTDWIARESPLPPADVAQAVATARNLPKSEVPWLLSILKGDPNAPLRKQGTPIAP